MTSSTWGIHAEAGWIEASGEVMALESHDTVVGSGPRGPGANVAMRVEWIFIESRSYSCFVEFCTEPQHDLRPLRWTGGVSWPSWTGPHDMAEKMDLTDPPTDCVARMEAEFESTVSNGRGHGYSMSVGGHFLSLTARTRYTTETSTKKFAQHKWERVGSTRRYHHLFVVGGIEDTDPGAWSCPASAPQSTWTDASNTLKTPAALDNSEPRPRFKGGSGGG